MPLEDIWREFFNWKANASEYSIYVHPHAGFKFPPSSFFHGREVKNSIDVKWGGLSQVRAIKLLVRAALEDPDNEWFTLMSESCIPLHPFQKWKRVLFSHNISIVNACPDMGPANIEVDRYRPSLEKVGILKSHFRKSATWFALQRRHATVFADETKLEDAWEGVPCLDEHYMPTIFAYFGLDNQTTCTDGFVHAFFPGVIILQCIFNLIFFIFVTYSLSILYFCPGISAHPQTHGGNDINADLFAYLNRPIARVGFSVTCSGFEELCHFTARKFSPASKYALLENIDLILNDDDDIYDGNPWAHYQSMMRRDIDGKSFYLIEQGRHSIRLNINYPNIGSLVWCDEYLSMILLRWLLVRYDSIVIVHILFT